MTRAGVEYNLVKSPYIVIIAGFKFYFSSRLYADKFLGKVEEQTERLKARCTSMLGVNIDASEAMGAFFGYYLTEKRGFLIQDLESGEYIKSIHDVIFSLEVL